MNVEIASFFLGTHGEIISADLTKMSGTKMTFVLFFFHTAQTPECGRVYLIDISLCSFKRLFFQPTNEQIVRDVLR